MKRITLSLLAIAGLGAGTVARADHVNVRGSISLGGPAYGTPAPVYVAPGPVYVAPRGYWREAPVNVWIPAHWAVRYDQFGQPMNFWEPGRYEVRTQRVWVENNYGHHDDRWDHNRWDDRDHDRDDRRWNR
jgi:hypothetical protein